MAVADFLQDIGSGLATGAKAVGSVLPALGLRTAQVVSGEAPQIDADKRHSAEQARELKANDLEAQLEMGRKYGTLTPDQQKQYVDQITSLYSGPENMDGLLKRLHRAVHPTGATYQLPDATPKGGTQAADDRSKVGSLIGTDDAKKQQALQSIQWFKQNMLPQFPPDQQAAKLNAYIDHINGITQGTEKPPKGLKAMEQGGVFFGIEDQDTGKQYLKSQLEPGGDAPPEAKQMYQAVQKAAKDKQDAADRKEKDAEERQTRAFAHAAQMVGLQMQKQIELGNIREAQATFKDAEKSYRSAAELSMDMQRNAAAAKKGDQQAQIAILTDHAGGTTKLAGGRLTKPIMDELTSSLPFLEGVKKKWQTGPDGVQYLTGVTLSPEQVDRMLTVAQNRVSVMKDSLDGIKADHPEAFPQDTHAKKVGDMLPKTGAQQASGQKPIVQHSASTGLYRYSTDGGQTWQPGQPPK